ncbi:MAG: hypothetical protein IKA72_03470 [Clostridia bacterium]|nr:hypothetical protein [Clostridia bacterium]
MRRKLLLTGLLAATVLFTAACSPMGQSKQKPLTGIDACFNEELGHYNESPSVIRQGATQYMFYTRNETKNDDTTDTIAVRKATLSGGKWSYGDAKTILRPSENGWDKASVFGADVVKGKFAFEGKTYSYLMVYSGSSKSNRGNAQIGFAVSETIDGEYIRVSDKPLVVFDKTTQTPVGLKNYKGAVEPSIVSYDQKGKVTVFYTFYGYFECNYAMQFDLSDLSAIKKSGNVRVNTAGVADGVENTMLYSGDWVYDPDEDMYAVCRNYGGKVSGLPTVSEAVQTLKASGADIYKINDNAPNENTMLTAVWSLYNNKQRRISAVHTAMDSPDGEDMTRTNGYKRIYNGCIASDAYGYTISSREINVYFTSSALSGAEGLEGDEYKFTPMIHEYTIGRGA